MKITITIDIPENARVGIERTDDPRKLGKLFYLPVGTVCYTVPWALRRKDGKYFIIGYYEAVSEKVGTAQLELKRLDVGVEISKADLERFKHEGEVKEAEHGLIHPTDLLAVIVK